MNQPKRTSMIIALLAVVSMLVSAGYTASASASLQRQTEVDARSKSALQASATTAFHRYLEAIDQSELDEAVELSYDPGDNAGRETLIEQLADFMKARRNNPVRNEAVVVRCSGDFAMVVYQYDTTIAGKTARIITTAWMIQFEGLWQQFIVAPMDKGFWESRLSDYQRLQAWFDKYAQQLSKPM